MAKIGVVGTGWGARTQVPAFRAAGLEVAGIAAQNSEKTRSVAAELKVRPFDHWRALVDSNVDLIAVSTPPKTHREIALAVLEAGKHLLCEKPMALSSAEAEEMAGVAGARPRQIAMIDFEMRFLPSWRTARERIGELGPIRHAEVRYCSPNWSDPQKEWKWWSDAAQGGGVWGAVGSHYTDALRYFLGEIRAAQGTLRTFVDQRPSPEGKRAVTSDDFAAVQLAFQGGALATLTLSAVAGVDEASSVTIHGERGALRLTGDQLFMAATGEKLSRVPCEEGAKSSSPFIIATDFLARALRARLDDGDAAALAPAATLQDGLVVQRAQDAARRSSREEGRWITL